MAVTMQDLPRSHVECSNRLPSTSLWNWMTYSHTTSNCFGTIRIRITARLRMLLPSTEPRDGRTRISTKNSKKYPKRAEMLDSRKIPPNTPKIPQKITPKYQKCPFFWYFFGIFRVFLGAPEFRPRGFLFCVFFVELPGRGVSGLCSRSGGSQQHSYITQLVSNERNVLKTEDALGGKLFLLTVLNFVSCSWGSLLTVLWGGAHAQFPTVIKEVPNCKQRAPTVSEKLSKPFVSKKLPNCKQKLNPQDNTGLKLQGCKNGAFGKPYICDDDLSPAQSRVPI